MEEFTQRVCTGQYKVGRIDPEHSKLAILLFPQKSPLKSELITHNIRVEASAVFAPELCSQNEDGYTYSIRISPTENLTECCQLMSRHWIISDGNEITEVRGEAVIGLYPIIRPGQTEPFVYQSCTKMRHKFGSMKGSFQMIPGTIKHPKGEPFDIEVGEFPINFPDWIF